MSDAANEKQRLYDRSNPEYSQAKGHNQRVKERYPEAWAASTLTNATLTEWVLTHKGELCAYCSNTAVEIDHKLPLSRNGLHNFDNLQMLCLPCNRSKHDLTDEEYKNLRPHMAVEDVAQSVGPIGLDDLDAVRALYFKIGDPTEYRVAQAVLGSADAWAKALEDTGLLATVRGWRLELRAKLKSEAIERLVAISAGGTSGALAAIKTLVTDDYLYTSFLDYGDVETRRGVGRPEKPILVESIPSDILNEDAERIGIPSFQREDTLGLQNI